MVSYTWNPSALEAEPCLKIKIKAENENMLFFLS